MNNKNIEKGGFSVITEDGLLILIDVDPNNSIFQLNDLSGFKSIDPNIRYLYSNSNDGTVLIDYSGGFNSNAMISFAEVAPSIANLQFGDSVFSLTTGSSAIDTNARVLQDITGSPILDWTNIFNPSAAISFSGTDVVFNSIIQDSYTTDSIDPNNRQLYANSAGGNSATLDWASCQLIDTAEFLSADWENRILFDSTGIEVSQDWGNRLLADSSGVTSENWMLRTLNDTGGNQSVYWGTRTLNTDLNAVMIDWTGSPAFPAYISFDNLNGLIDLSVPVADESNTKSWDPAARQFFDGLGNLVLDYSVLNIVNVNENLAVGGDVLDSSASLRSENFNLRILYANDGSTNMLNWLDPSVGLIIYNKSSAPASPVAGATYFDTTLNQLGYWNGTTWVYL